MRISGAPTGRILVVIARDATQDPQLGRGNQSHRMTKRGTCGQARVSGNDMMAGTDPGLGVPSTCRFPGSERHVRCHGTVESLTSAGFTSSVVITLDGWRAFVNHDTRQVALLTDEELGHLSE
jgi:hypothetical protein